jgi:hypothetical protein
VPSLDLRFADNKSLTDAVTGQQLITFTRASTGTFTDSAGTLQTAATDVPRFDHNPTTGESLGLLVEEARTNLLQRSEEFDNAGTWGVLNATVTANTQLAPNGTTSAETLTDVNGVTSANVGCFQSTTLADSTTYAMSCYVKAGTKTTCRVGIRAKDGTNILANFNLSAASTTAGNALSSTIQDAGNGWYRCTAICASATGATGPRGIVFIDTASYTANGTGTIQVWGAQLEAGAFPTSYIPTTTAAATRAADVASITGSAFSSWYRQDEGTVFGVATINGIAAQNYIAAIDAGAGFADSHLYYAVTGTPRFETFVASTNQSQLIPAPATALTAGSQFAMGYAFKQNDFAASRNGGSVATDVSGNVPTANRLAIGSSGSAFQLNGTIRRLTYWPQALPSRLQSITQ